MHNNHKKNFQYLNFHTEFSVSGNNRIPHGVRSCFYELVCRHKTRGMLSENDLCSNKYRVYVYFTDYINDCGTEENNCCLLSREELSKWIDDMKRFADFEYNLEDNKYAGEGESVIVNIKFEDRPFVEHFLVLELLKHSYEFPFNFSVYQAVKMHDVINSEELLVNIHNMIFCCNSDFVYSACSDHILNRYENVYTNVYSSVFSQCMSFPVIYMPTAEEITKRCEASNALYKIFHPAYVNIDDFQYDDLRERMVYNINKDVQSEDEELNEYRKLLYEYSRNFEYFNNKDHNCNIKSFDSYFDVALSKQRLDVYIKTYDAIKYYGRQN